MVHSHNKKKKYPRDYKSCEYNGSGKLHRKITAKFNEKFQFNPESTLNVQKLENLYVKHEVKRLVSHTKKIKRKVKTINAIPNIFTQNLVKDRQ
jgi:hypothetical protein